MSKEIPLTRGQVALVSDVYFEWVSQWKWYAHQGSDDTFYGARHTLKAVDSNRPIIKMHTAIWEHHNNRSVPDGYTVDHIDRNPLNDHESNLRLATQSQQVQNQKRRSTNTSGYIGVNFHKPTQKHRAFITIDKKPVHLGLFDDPIEAAHVRDVAAIEQYGEFAVLNFPVND